MKLETVKVKILVSHSFYTSEAITPRKSKWIRARKWEPLIVLLPTKILVIRLFRKRCLHPKVSSEYGYSLGRRSIFQSENARRTTVPGPAGRPSRGNMNTAGVKDVSCPRAGWGLFRHNNNNNNNNINPPTLLAVGVWDHVSFPLLIRHLFFTPRSLLDHSRINP